MAICSSKASTSSYFSLKIHPILLSHTFAKLDFRPFPQLFTLCSVHPLLYLNFVVHQRIVNLPFFLLGLYYCSFS